MVRWLTIFGFLACLGGVAVAATTAGAEDLAAELARCRGEPDDAQRLACYDGLAERAKATTPDAALQAARQALDREFTFSSRAWRDGPLSFHIPVTGVYSPANRAAVFPMPEVESAATKIQRALADFGGWRLAVTVEPARADFGRSTPYTGQELKAQAEDALARSGLAGDRYDVIIGAPPNSRPSAVDPRREANAIVRIAIQDLP